MTDTPSRKAGDILRERGIEVVENTSTETTILFLGPKGAAAMEAAVSEQTNEPDKDAPP